jgi:UDP-3-O-[3-hydroxymyristoyl] glucosamine N-acyltransferase
MRFSRKFEKIGINKNVIFGKDVEIIKPVNLYGCKIEEKVFIGSFVEIQKNVKIGRRTRVQSHTFICELVTIGTIVLSVMA